MKTIIFKVHECGCVEVEKGDDDTFEWLTIAGFILTHVNSSVPPLVETLGIINYSIRRLRRSFACVMDHPGKHAN